MGEDARTIFAPAIGEEGQHGDAENTTLEPPGCPRKEGQDRLRVRVLWTQSDNVEGAIVDKTINRWEAYREGRMRITGSVATMGLPAREGGRRGKRQDGVDTRSIE